MLQSGSFKTIYNNITFCFNKGSFYFFRAALYELIFVFHKNALFHWNKKTLMTSWIGKGSIKSFLVEFISLEFPIECHQLATLRKARFHKTFFAVPTIKRVRVKQLICSPLTPTYFPPIFRLACYQQAGWGWVWQRKWKVRWR